MSTTLPPSHCQLRLAIRYIRYIAAQHHYCKLLKHFFYNFPHTDGLKKNIYFSENLTNIII